MIIKFSKIILRKQKTQSFNWVLYSFIKDF